MKAYSWICAVWRVSATLVIGLLLSVSSVYGQPSSVAPLDAGGYAPDSILVRYKPSATANDKAQARGLANAASHRAYGLVRGLENMRLKPGQGVIDAVDKLSRLPFIEYAEPDYLVQKASTKDTFFKSLVLSA